MSTEGVPKRDRHPLSLVLWAGAVLLAGILGIVAAFVPLVPCPEIEAGIRRAAGPSATEEELEASKQRLVPFHQLSNCWLCGGRGRVTCMTRLRHTTSSSGAGENR